MEMGRHDAAEYHGIYRSCCCICRTDGIFLVCRCHGLVLTMTAKMSAMDKAKLSKERAEARLRGKPSDPRIWIHDKPGLYAIRLVSGGPELACRVAWGPPLDPDTGEVLDRSWRWTIEIDGVMVYSGMSPHERSGRPIERPEYDYLIETAKWDREFAPDSASANPRKKMDISAAPLPF